MELQTYGLAKTKIEKDLDIQGDNIIEEDEMLANFNSAVDDAENIIHQLHEDYFLTSDYVAMVDGTSDYAMPTNIYANKIRKIIYKKDNESYEVKKIKLMHISDVDAEDDYKYNIENNTGAAGTRFIIYPAARDTSSTYMRRWYVRNASKIVDSDSVIDIPEFVNYVYSHVKYWCAFKIGHPRMAGFKEEMDKQEMMMRNNLTAMIEDGNIDIDPDISFYEDFDTDY